MVLKARIVFEDITSVSCSKWRDGFVLVHVKETPKGHGDVILRAEVGSIEFITKLMKNVYDTTKQANISIGNQVTLNTYGKPTTIVLQIDSETPEVKMIKKGNQVTCSIPNDWKEITQ
jgi:hypothetical protein